MALHNPSIPSDGIKNECRFALELLRDDKDHRDAARCMDRYCSPGNPKTKTAETADTALCHRVLATIYTKAASGAAKDKDKRRFVRRAIENARKAVNQCPNSIEFAHFYANLLYEAAGRRDEYERVAVECRRALSIENPVDPAAESLLEEYEQKISTAKDRVANVQDQLRLLIRKSSFAVDGPWVKDLGDEEENVQLLLLTTKPEDPMYEILEVKKGSGNAGNESSTDVRETIRSYWNTLSAAARKDIFRIQISELRGSLGPLKDKAGDDALLFGVENKMWKFWRCCAKEFADRDLFMKHVSENHDRTSLPEYLPLEPKRVEDEWAQMLLECSWKPLELNGVIGNEDGPLFDEPERALLLEKIHVIFQSLVENKDLALSQINWVKRYAMEELQSLACSTDILSSKLMENPSCIRVLGAPALNKILDFLQEMFDASRLSRHSDKSVAADSSNTGADFVEKIIFSQDSSSLIIEVPRSLPPKVSGLSSDDAANVNYEDGEALDADTLLSWLFEGPGITEALESWDQAKEKKLHKCSETIRLLDKEFLHVLQRLYLRKREHMSYSDKLQDLENLCSDARENRGNSTGFLPRCYDSFLRKRRKELIDSTYENNEEVMISSRFELDAITNVLKEAESLNVNRFDTEMSEMTYVDLRSHLRIPESGEGVDQRTKKELLHQLDSCIEVAIHRQKEDISLETSKHDARLMQAIARVKDLRNELFCASSHDYRSILIPLLRSFLQERLKGLALEHAAIMSLLANNDALDSKNFKHGNSNDKKKGQKNRDTQASKDNSSDETHDQKTEERLHPSGQDDGTEQQLIKDEEVDGDGGKGTPENSYSSVYCSGSVIDVNALGTHRRGLINDVGQNNCFLNVIIQSLWHLARFRDELMRKQSGHLRVGDPCVICALYKVFIELGTAPRDNRGQSVSPALLRFALSKWSSKKFPLAQRCVALEAFDEILNCLDIAFKNSPDVPGVGSEVSAGTDSGDCCTNSPCIARSLFGMDVTLKISCDKGCSEAIDSEYRSYYHLMRAGDFRKNKDYTFDAILYHDGWHRKPCGHCETGSAINRTISKLPHVYTIDLGWETMIESVNNIMETLAVFPTEFNPSVFCTNPVPNSKYRLVSVACFIGAGTHYQCFVYDRDCEDWIIFNDTIVQVVGSWEDVLRMCEKGNLQPEVWMYELEN